MRSFHAPPPFFGLDAEDRHASFVGCLIALQDLDGRRLAGAVLAQETKDLAALDAEGHVIHGGEGPEALGEPGHLDDVRH